MWLVDKNSGSFPSSATAILEKTKGSLSKTYISSVTEESLCIVPFNHRASDIRIHCVEVFN
jgi:hypothetical protein